MRASERTYLRTHPWITFQLNLRAFSPRLWMLLGEAASKCEHIANTPLKPGIAQEMHKVYLAKGALATTAIEGNTLSEEQVRQHLEGTLDLPPASQYLQQEVDNIVNACNGILGEVMSGAPVHLTLGRILERNRQVLNGLQLNEGVVPGEIPSHEVSVGSYHGAPRRDCMFLLEKLCDWLNSLDESLAFLPPAGRAVVKSVIAHLYLAWIHPFGDGNGRTARLLEFELLLAAHVPSPAAHLFSNHYNETRREYYRQLAAASQQAEIADFLEYAAAGFVEGLRQQLAQYIWPQQWDIGWRDYIYELFRGKNTSADSRRRELALRLSSHGQPLQTSAVRQLSPALAAAYASKEEKTVTRDINELVRMDLVERTTRGQIRARTERLFAFLPPRKPLQGGQPEDTQNQPGTGQPT